MKTKQEILEGLKKTFEDESGTTTASLAGVTKPLGKVKRRKLESDDKDKSVVEGLSTNIKASFAKWAKKNLKLHKEDFMQNVIEDYEDHLQDNEGGERLSVSDITSFETIIKKTVFK